jgi:putative phosphoesterase
MLKQPQEFVEPAFYEFDLKYNDFKLAADFKTVELPESRLEELIGGYDIKSKDKSGKKYRNFDRTICVVSDTHNDIERLMLLVRFCNRYQIRLMIHCGDLVDHEILGKIHSRYKGLYIFTMGNHDRTFKRKRFFQNYFKYNHSRKIMTCPYEAHLKVFDEGRVSYTNNVGSDERFRSQTAPHLYFRVYHGDNYAHLFKIINEHSNYDVFIYGHTHQPDYRVLNYGPKPKIILNPSSFSFNMQDDKMGFMILGVNDKKLSDVIKVTLH